MKIYVDVILILNFLLDRLLLIGVSILLKRNKPLKRLIIGALIGSISILFLFISISSLELFLVKIIISIIMILISFGYKNIKYFISNLSYLYLLSIILGGFLYFINDTLSYKNTGLIFYHNSFSINIILVLILSPVIIYIYIKSQNKIKYDYSKIYKVEITFLNGKNIVLNGFLDTGNSLIDPYKKRPIILIEKSILKDYKPRCILVPCYTVNKKSMLSCFKIKKISINDKKIKKECLVGISDNNFKLEDAKILLNKNILKEID